MEDNISGDTSFMQEWNRVYPAFVRFNKRSPKRESSLIAVSLYKSNIICMVSGVAFLIACWSKLKPSEVVFNKRSSKRESSLISGSLYKSKIIWCKNAYEAALNADVLVILTEWNEFRALDLKKLKKLLKRNVIVDLRNIYNPIEIRENGFEYYSVGRVS